MINIYNKYIFIINIHNKQLLQIDIKKTTDKMGKSDEIIEEQL